MIYLTRRIALSMAHRMHNPRMSDDENRSLYGKCNNPNGHGHAYVVEATLGSRHIDPATGFSASLEHLDATLRRVIFDRYDHLDFDRDFPEHQGLVSSGETLVRLFWDLLSPHFAASAPLVRLRLEETEKNSFEYFGQGGDPFTRPL